LGNSKAAVKGELAGARSALQMAIRHPERVTALVLLVLLAQAADAGGFPASAGALGRCVNDAAERIWLFCYQGRWRV